MASLKRKLPEETSEKKEDEAPAKLPKRVLIKELDNRELIWDTKDMYFKEGKVKFIDNYFMIELLEKNTNAKLNVHIEPESVEVNRVIDPGEQCSTLLVQVHAPFKLSKIPLDDIERGKQEQEPLLRTHSIYLILKMIPSGLEQSVEQSLNLSPSEHFNNKRPAAKEIELYFAREKQFYEIMWPSMAKKMEILTIYNSRNYIVPRYFSCSRPYCIFLQDICHDYFETIDRMADLDYEHTSVALKYLARLHATSIALKHSNMEPSDPFESLVEYQMDPNNILFYIYTSGLRVLALEAARWEGLWHFAPVIEDLAKRAYTDIKYYLTTFGQIKVFIHGDFWAGNILFKYKTVKGSHLRTPEIARLIDFQCCQWGSPAIDVLNLFYVSADSRVFKEKNKLIQQYQKDVQEFLQNRFCLNGIILFPDEKFKVDIQNATLYGLLKGLTMRFIKMAHRNDPSDFTSLMTGECFKGDSYWREIIRVHRDYLEPLYKLF